MHRITFCQTNRLFILLEQAETEIHFQWQMARSKWKWTSIATVPDRVSSKQSKINFGSNRNKPKQDLFRVCFGLFRETKKKTISVCFGVSNLYRNNRNKQSCFVTNRNNPKFLEKFPNILSFQLFGWVFCLFRVNRTLCFGIEAKQPKQTVQKQTEKNQKKTGKTLHFP